MGLSARVDDPLLCGVRAPDCTAEYRIGYSGDEDHSAGSGSEGVSDVQDVGREDHRIDGNAGQWNATGEGSEWAGSSLVGNIN